MSDRSGAITGRLVFGLLVIFFGALFTLDNLDVMEAGPILQFWPLAPLAFGLARLAGIGGRRSLVSGLFFTLGGFFLLLRNLDVMDFGLWDFWPLVLILIGGAMVRGALRRRHAAPGTPGVSKETGESGTFSAMALWSGSERQVASQAFRGGDVTAIMGGHEIDLRAAKMAGESAVIDLCVIMGGVNLRVPEDWRVSHEALAVMGGVEDKSNPPATARGNLILQGIVVMGGIEVKN